MVTLSVFLIPQANDRHLEMAGQSELFRKYPRKASILNMPLVTTLFYSCFYHYTEAEVRMMWQKTRVASHPCSPQDVEWSSCGMLRKEREREVIFHPSERLCPLGPVWSFPLCSKTFILAQFVRELPPRNHCKSHEAEVRGTGLGSAGGAPVEDVGKPNQRTNGVG